MENYNKEVEQLIKKIREYDNTVTVSVVWILMEPHPYIFNVRVKKRNELIYESRFLRDTEEEYVKKVKRLISDLSIMLHYLEGMEASRRG